ncbi:MAG: HAMP domain-containing protein [Spirochaetaceae bacterium]|jgi:signal transduction histidine kinase|nr:HAMP domain-containing protein [Spirochaetaceae bacterium]
MTVTLRKCLSLVYALFVSLSLFVLSLVIGLAARRLFSDYVKGNIEESRAEIVRLIGEQYNPFFRDFNRLGVGALGMHFMHQGYLISLEDTAGRTLWSVREIESQHCAVIMEEIQTRMKDEFQVTGGFRTASYPVVLDGAQVGTVAIESFGPVFYSENESRFITSLNRVFAVSGLFFVALCVILSLLLATALSRPILDTATAAEKIASGDFSVRLPPARRIRELSRLSLAINDLASALENGEKWQSRLTSDIAHELRTPLTVLQGNIEGMIDGVLEPTKERLENCNGEIAGLNKLINDLAKLSLLEREHLVLHRSGFDISGLLASLVSQFTPLASAKGLSLTANLERAPVHGDYDRLTQVFVNLLSNAVKYTDTGSITVTARPAPRKSGDAPRAIVTVEDTGIGIPPEDLPHVFDRLYRTDKSRNRDTGGAGIGLAVALSIVKAHGGTITAQSPSPAGRGSVFTVSV